VIGAEIASLVLQVDQLAQHGSTGKKLRRKLQNFADTLIKQLYAAVSGHDKHALRHPVQRGLQNINPGLQA
jgi:hypothetical protein